MSAEPETKEKPSMAEELDRALEQALQAAVLESQSRGFVNTAQAFSTIRDYVMRNREVMLDRIKEYGIITMQEEQQKQLLSMVATAMVEKAIRDAQERQNNKNQAFWTTRTAKIGAVTGVITLVLLTFTTIYSVLFGVAHPLVSK